MSHILTCWLESSLIVPLCCCCLHSVYTFRTAGSGAATTAASVLRSHPAADQRGRRTSVLGWMALNSRGRTSRSCCPVGLDHPWAVPAVVESVTTHCAPTSVHVWQSMMRCYVAFHWASRASVLLSPLSSLLWLYDYEKTRLSSQCHSFFWCCIATWNQTFRKRLLNWIMYH